jgi:hypothetical protein
MPILESNELTFQFPQVEQDASCAITFKRTLRIPDTDKVYDLPPGLGNFALRHVEDYPDGLDEKTRKRGGVIMPMWQSEAMWINFSTFYHPADRGSARGWGRPSFPVAIKVAAGKINAVTGENWRPGLNQAPQDYVVAPDQPWLDGFAVEKGVIRQFVAMPLGEGYTAEEQLSGEAEWGGVQISVTPLKSEVWERIKSESSSVESMPMCAEVSMACESSMGLAAGGQMRQHIYPDPYNTDDWDIDATDRVFVTLCHARDWKKITGEAPRNFPPSAEDYSKAGMPWFAYYGADQQALAGSEKLRGLKSVGALHKETTGVVLPDSQDVIVPSPKHLGDHRSQRIVRSASDF